MRYEDGDQEGALIECGECEKGDGFGDFSTSTPKGNQNDEHHHFGCAGKQAD